MTCEVCGNIGHMGNHCPETRENINYVNNNGYRAQGGQGWNNNNNQRPNYQGNNYNSNFNSNQPSLKDLVLGQAKINKNLTNKLSSHDKMLDIINNKLENLTSGMKNQISFNKMIETQLEQIATAVPLNKNGKIPGQPETSRENVNAVATRSGKTTRDPPMPSTNHGVGRTAVVEEPS